MNDFRLIKRWVMLWWAECECWDSNPRHSSPHERHFQCRTFGLSVTSPEYSNCLLFFGLCQVKLIEFLLLVALLLVPATNRVSSRLLQDTSRAASLLLGGTPRRTD